MAVHAAVLLQIVVGQRILVEVLNAALFYLQSVPYRVAWLYQSVGKIAVDAVAHHIPTELLVRCPLSVLQGSYFHLYRVVLLQQFAPLAAHAELYVSAFAVYGHSSSLHLHCLCTSHHKVQRCNVHWYRNILVVRIYLRLLRALHHIVRCGRASSKQRQQCQR